MQVKHREAVERGEGRHSGALGEPGEALVMQETRKQGMSAKRDSGRVAVAQFSLQTGSCLFQCPESQLTSVGPTGTGLSAPERPNPRKTCFTLQMLQQGWSCFLSALSSKLVGTESC